MSPERWQQIEEVFQSALDLAPQERSAHVAAACADDADLRAQVEALIAQHEASEDFIEEPALNHHGLLQHQAFTTQGADEAPDPMAGRRVGAYEIVREIGRGGMGAVYLAERRDGEFHRRVAVKLVKRGMDTDFVLSRFRHERQILASLDHPNIAKLLDGGTTDDGLPYFVMEYVEGQPIYCYCDERKLTTAERLHLFCQVCGAVQYAHRHKIVHRDIKPSNILVTEEGRPKLLDFGIAKLLDPELASDTLAPTLTAMRLMTPEYASPEQARGEQITAATDIYSLGVLLYELLTGHRPYRFTARSPHEIARVICEDDPLPPSQAIARRDNMLPLDRAASETSTIEFVCRTHGATLDELRRQLAGNLDSIILKALSKEPEQRYASVQDLCQDITRHLEGRPVSAPFRFSAKTQKQEARRRDDDRPASEKIVAVLPLKLINAQDTSETGDSYLGTGLADALITRLGALRRFVVRPTSSVLRYDGANASDPLVAGQQLGVNYVVDGRIRRFGERIRVTVQLLGVRDGAALWAGQFDEQFTDVLSLEDAISTQVAEALVPQLTGDERRQLAKRGTDNAEAFEAYLQGRYHWNTFTEEGFAKALTCYYRAIACDPTYALAYTGIADYYNWLGIYGVLPPAECCASAKEAAAKAVELDDTLAEAHAALGFALLTHGFEWERAMKHLRRAVELNSNLATAHGWLSLQLAMEGRFDEAIDEARRAAEIDSLSSYHQHNVGWLLYHARRYDESITQYRKVIDSDPRYGFARYGYACSLRELGRFDEAINEAKKAIELVGESPFFLALLGTIYARGKRDDEARAVLRRLEELAAERYVSPYHLALVRCNLGEREQALELLEQAYANRDAWLAWLAVDPQLNLLRSDARYADLLRRINYPSLTAATNNAAERHGASSDAVNNKVAPELRDSHAGASHLPAKVGALDLAPHRSILRAYPRATAAIIVLLTFALTAATLLYARRSREAPPDAAPNSAALLRSIAVLPFKTVGDDEYLGVGLADAVSSKLPQIANLTARQSSAVRRYLNTSKTPVEVGRELGVDYILAGRIERADNRVQTALELVDVVSEKVLWREQLNETFTDIAELQSSITERVARALNLQLTRDERARLNKRPTTSGEAYSLYLAGRYHWGKRTPEGIRQAINSFEQAIEKDPRYALAYAGLDDCYALLNWYAEPPPADAFARAEQAARRAIELDDTLAEAHASLAFIRFHYNRDYTGSEAQFRRAISLNPNYATAHHWFAFLLSAQGRHTEALAEIKQAQQLDPRSPTISSELANVLYYARRFDEAIAQCQKALELDPGSVGAHAVMRWAYEQQGQFDAALAAYEKERAFAGDTPTTRAKRAHVLAATGHQTEARRILQDLLARREQEYVTPYEIAVIYSLLNEPDAAFQWLERAAREHAVGFSFVKVDPQLDNIRVDPRYDALLRSAGITN